MYKGIVRGGFDSIPLTLEEALEYAFECNTEHVIVNLETGKFIELEEAY